LYIFSELHVKSGVGATTPEEERRGCVVLTPNDVEYVPHFFKVVKITVLFYIRILALQCFISKNNKSLDMRSAIPQSFSGVGAETPDEGRGGCPALTSNWNKRLRGKLK
jgi:hypothetical protein